MSEEKLRWFWMGKSPRLRKAVEHYINSILNEDWEPQFSIAEIFGTTRTSIQTMLKKIKADAFIYNYYFGTNMESSKQHIPKNKKRKPLDFRLIPIQRRRR